MELEITALGPIGANCYQIHHENQLCVIDPGDEADRMLEKCKDKNLSLILLTHGHYDHVGAVKALKEAHPNAMVYIHQGDAQGAGSQLCPLAGEVENLQYLDDGQEIPFGDTNIKVIATPGHSEGSVCFLLADHLFTGDTLFAGSMGRVDLPGGNYQTIMKSLKKLSSLPDSLHVHPGHDISSTMGAEKKSNPYMREAMNS